MKIRQLPDILANKIAAGEVVERPASVVKELLENSIDAESTNIQITLKEAGIEEISVIDNGFGMEEADCKRAFLRHATSKIQYDQDLFHIKSLGFRGEALASIASVSKLTLVSSTGHGAGTHLYLEGGVLQEEKKSPARRGTEITVEELFYNTPARLKYMKSIHTELGHITDLVNRYALAHPEISFHLIHKQKTILKTTGSDNRLQVIQQIYGNTIAKNMIQIQGETLDFKLDGYIAKPEHTRANRNYMTLIVNGRYIKHYGLFRAIIDGYDTLLPIHRFPIVIVSVTMDPILTDVNVHPTKLEIRFSKERELMNMIENAVKQAFKKMTLIPEMERKPKEKVKTEQPTFSFSNQKHQQIKETINIPTMETVMDINKIDDSIEEVVQPTMVDHVEPNMKQNHIEPKGYEQLNRVPTMYPIGQLQGTYILAQNEYGFYMVDQHAAQERIKYEFYKKKLGETTRDEQQLLMPLTFDLVNEERIFIEEHQSLLNDIGLFLEHFGSNTYAVRSHPTWFPKGEEEQTIRDLIQQVIQKGKTDIEKLREEAAILMSCKRSIKANHYLKEEEIERLLEELSATTDPFTCPHGRPVIIHFTYYEIEKMFKRIM